MYFILYSGKNMCILYFYVFVNINVLVNMFLNWFVIIYCMNINYVMEVMVYNDFKVFYMMNYE